MRFREVPARARNHEVSTRPQGPLRRLRLGLDAQDEAVYAPDSDP
jgi:hypothetical protein